MGKMFVEILQELNSFQLNPDIFIGVQNFQHLHPYFVMKHFYLNVLNFILIYLWIVVRQHLQDSPDVIFHVSDRQVPKLYQNIY